MNMSRLFKTVVSALALVGVVVMLGCGGGGGGGGGSSPQALAKQNVALFAELGKLMQSNKDKDSPEVKALDKKSDALKEKINQLSPEDKKIYEEEFGRLMTEASSKK